MNWPMLMAAGMLECKKRKKTWFAMEGIFGSGYDVGKLKLNKSYI